MIPIRSPLFGCLAVTFALLLAVPAQAASLQRVDDWGAMGVPSTASMYIYVPDEVAATPPILVVLHYCGGTAGAVFGQAQGGGIVAAADQYGFIIVVPETSNNCWDVGSTKALTHDGGGDTHAVAQMVTYAITAHGANADRVYATGDSGGGMMTQALLAVYPEVFKGGSEFAGVPAGCWAAGNPDGSWSSQCAGGQVTHTAEEWGDIARAMVPGGYVGHRPRVQLFHGDDDQTIDFQNHTEAIKQWINVLGLSETPTSTDTVALGSHQATRERWENSCGYVVLDAFTSLGGDHGPSDAIFDASFVIPFLGLDITADTDPEITECGAGGAGGAAGSAGAAMGGAAGSAGAAMGGATSGGAGESGSAGMSGGAAVGGTSGAAAMGAGGVNAVSGGTAGAIAGAATAGALGVSGAGAGFGVGGTVGQGGSGGSAAAPTGSTVLTSGSAGASALVPNDTSTVAGGGCRTTNGKSSLNVLHALALAALLVRRKRWTPWWSTRAR